MPRNRANSGSAFSFSSEAQHHLVISVSLGNCSKLLQKSHIHRLFNPRNEIGASEPGWDSMLDQISQAYFRRREQAERAAAKKAESEAARRVHQELAQSYAEMLRKS